MAGKDPKAANTVLVWKCVSLLLFFSQMRHFSLSSRIYIERQVREMDSSLRTDEEIAEIYNRYVETVYRICFSFMKNTADTDDLVQETFLKLILSKPKFQSKRHEKAWLIVTASNVCKDALKHWSRRAENIDDYPSLESETPFREDGMLSAVLALPVKYKDVVYLYYYEGYHTSEIAGLLHCSASTVRNRLVRARKLLKKQ